MESNPQGSPYTQIIDLTTKAQRAERDEQAKSLFPEPDPKLPEATPETFPPAVRRAFDATGWTDLMPVQEKAIPYILDGRDLIVAIVLGLWLLIRALRRPEPGQAGEVQWGRRLFLASLIYLSLLYAAVILDVVVA